MRNDFDISKYDKEGYAFIAAAPRSGTQYIAKVFQEVGVDIQHEAFGEAGISAFHTIPHLACRKHGVILHQVRDPLKTIASMQIIDASWGYITYYTGISRPDGDLLHAVMRLWLLLNHSIEKYDHIRYRIEDIDTEWPRLCNILNIPKCSLPDIPRNAHSRAGEFRPLTWHELEFRDRQLTKCIKDTAVRYGYEVSA